MLSASAYSFRQKSRLAISLSWIAGYTNVITFIICGATTTHATGNVTRFGESVAELHWWNAFYFAFLLLTFLLGAAASGFMTEGARRSGFVSKYILPMAVEAAMLCLLALAVVLYGVSYSNPLPSELVWARYWISGVACFAMGLQNATITKVSGAEVRTTHLTGVLTDLGLHGVQYLMWARQRTRGRRSARAARVMRVSARQPSAMRLFLLLSILGSFLFGVIMGTLLFERFPSYALLLPVAFLLWIVFVDWRKPIADVREIDLLADPESDAYASLKAFLPPELGIYRLSHHRRDAVHHAPDFQLWVERLPKRWRVIILAISPMTFLDNEAVLDLGSAIARLRQDHRDLIICGANRPQYKALHNGGVVQQIGIDNICPDLDFAIARGLNLVGDQASGRS